MLKDYHISSCYQEDRNVWLKNLLKIFSWLIYFVALFYVPIKVFFGCLKKILTAWHRAALFEKRVGFDKLEFRFRRYLW